MFVGSKSKNDPTIFSAPPLFQKLRFMAEKLCNQAAKLLLGKTQNSHIFKTNLNFIPSYYLSKTVKNFKPDLVIVYYVADFLSERQIFAIREATDAPIAFYLMDMGMLTGSCHYAWQCSGYTSGCNSCPKFKSPFWKSVIRKKFASRRHYYNLTNPIVVAGSEELLAQAKSSALTNGFIKKKILIGIDPVAYGSADRVNGRQSFGLSGNDFVIYFGAQNVDDERKGFIYLRKALELLHKRLSTDEINRICLLTVGGGNPFEKSPLLFKHVHIAYISDPILFSKTYSVADVFVCPSIEDSGPMMINEAIMSGTPVIAFKSGVAFDLVIDYQTGFTVEKYSSEMFATRIAEVFSMNISERECLRKNCRELALEISSIDAQVNAFIEMAKHRN